MTPSVSPVRMSVVVACRNDNHGGNLLLRLQWFIDVLGQYGATYGGFELILVEWNPPVQEQPLEAAVDWTRLSKLVPVRIIHVPPEVHARFAHADRLPLFQMIAKNVGIRRARGGSVLATNVDVLLSPSLAKDLLARSLRSNRMYRVDRYDVRFPPECAVPAEDRLQYCREHVVRINEYDCTTDLRSGAIHRIYNKQRLREALAEILQDLGLARAYSRSRLHTNACGDFTLLSKDAWGLLRGYPELEMYSFHLDSLLCHAAHHMGYTECRLPFPSVAYHLEHAIGSGWSPEGESALASSLKSRGVPQLSHQQFDEWAEQMRRDRKPILWNSDDWGLANDKLVETSLS